MSGLITDAMVARGALEARAWGVVSKHGEWTNEETQQQCARDILEAVAPLIAAAAWEEGYQACRTRPRIDGYLINRSNPHQTHADAIERGES